MTDLAPTPRHPAILVLEDGRTWEGSSFGSPGETFGEVMFTTGMTGYQETLTDPSYRRQIVVATAPHIGNTGWNSADGESSHIWVAGYVVRDPSRVCSSWRSEQPLAEVLRAQEVVGIADVDTRAITRHVREHGAMRAGISSTELDPEKLLAKVLTKPKMSGARLFDEVTRAEKIIVPAQDRKKFTVAAVDLGMKNMSVACLSQRHMDVHVLPAGLTFETIAAIEPDGVFFSNGPGDPAAAGDKAALLRAVLDAHLPYFGICLGHQLFGRALGFSTYKLPYGHHGINQPVMDLTTRKVEITSHNHGFAVDAPAGRDTPTPWGLAHVSHINLNDDVVEGLELRRDGKLAGFSVQYHPEAAAGPHDSVYLFDRFAAMMGGNA